MFLYNCGIYLVQCAINIAALFNPKAKLWVNGRKNWKKRIQNQVNELNLKNAIWFHCASLGEFEQGRPVIESIKKNYPKQKIVLTFFSPSGYEIQKNYQYVDAVLYLPADTRSNANYFLEILNPSIAIFVKYEFWLNYLFTLQKKRTPTFLISTVIKTHQSFFKWYGANFRKALTVYQTIFTQDIESIKLLDKLNIKSGELAGDTRFDRVLEISSFPKELPLIKQFSENSFVIIAGSSWQKDEECLIETYLKLKSKYANVKLIITPHEVDTNNVNRLKKTLIHNNITFDLYSHNLEKYTNSVLVIDAVGFLSSIYQYGAVAFIGGGFNDGIHNILEPAVFGLPVLFGPNYKKFNEAYDVINLKAGFVVHYSEELTNQISVFLNDNNYYTKTHTIAKDYVLKHSGATARITQKLNPLMVQN